MLSTLCLIGLSLVSCNDDKTAMPYTPESDGVPAYELANIWTAYDAFNKVYLDPRTNVYKNQSSDAAAINRWNGAAAIWCQPMYVDMAMNATNLARKTGDAERERKYTDLSRRIIDGNIDLYVNFDFDNCDETYGWFIYDDIQWWTITMARAYQNLGDERYRTYAEKSFARVWYGSPRVGDTGSYADPDKGLGGGMFWQWQPLRNPEANEANHGKMSCINFPTVIAAMLLYNTVPADRGSDPNPEKWTNKYGDFVRPAYESKQRYLEMAKEIYEWAAANLGDMSTGKIFDNRHGETIGDGSLIYNQGTFIGASALLYLATGEQRYLDNAVAGAEYSINEMSTPYYLLPWAHDTNNPYSQGSLEQGIYPAIWIQYMDILVNECGQEQFRKFIERNIGYGWANRDKSRDIADGESWTSTIEGAEIGSYAASSIPSMMLLFPSSGK